MKVNYDTPQPIGAGVNSVFPRLEYRYKDRLKLKLPKLNALRQFGSYGMIEISVVWFYPLNPPGKIYQSVFNAPEASYWLAYYQHDGNVTEAHFVPSPDQFTSGTFSIPISPPVISPVSPAAWYIEDKEAGAYAFGNDKHTF